MGRVVRPHGLRGEVVLDFWSDQPQRLARGSRLRSAAGELEVAAARPHQGRHLVSFTGVADRAAAERLRGLVLKAEPLERPDVLWVHELVGAAVETTRGRQVGRVVAVEANPASDLLVLGDGRVVPLTFVVAHRPGEAVVVDPPAGLLDELDEG